MRLFCLLALFTALGGAAPVWAQYEEADGFVSLFNEKDLTGWKVPEGDKGHWRVVDGVIDYDAGSEAKQDKNLWTTKSYRDFILKIDWRLKTDPQAPYNVPIVLQDGSTLKDAAGQEITIKRFSPDSGLYLRGVPQAQINMWGWPVGSGEVYAFRNQRDADRTVRASVTPRLRADHPMGEWNRFEIYMIQNRLTVMLNQQLVLENAELKGIPEEGPIALQHHGGRTKDDHYGNRAASSLIQFRNIWIRELPRE